jgi:hypothetical protein
MKIPEQPTIPPMPAPKPGVKCVTPESNNDLRLIIKELHNISQELNTLNKIIRKEIKSNG